MRPFDVSEHRFIFSRFGVAIALALVTIVAPASAQEERPDPGSSWDEVFLNEKSAYVREPNAFLLRCLERIGREGLAPEKGKALVIGIGDGRNAIPLATHGFDVTGLDISSVALEKARQAGAAKGVEIRTVKADVFQHDLGDGTWDLVTNIYFNPSVQIMDRIRRAVRPGGLLLIEGYHKDYTGPGPPEWSRYGTNQLLQELPGWRILAYEDGLFPSDWPAGQTLPIVRLLARKPG